MLRTLIAFIRGRTSNGPRLKFVRSSTPSASSTSGSDAEQARADQDKSSPDTDNPLAFYSTVELFDEIGRRSSTLVCAYKPLVCEPGFTWAQIWRGQDFDSALGLSRRLWHSFDQDARRSAK
jgi:hypothetical protein